MDKAHEAIMSLPLLPVLFILLKMFGSIGWASFWFLMFVIYLLADYGI